MGKAALDGLLCGERVFSSGPTRPLCASQSAGSGELLLHPAELAETLQRTVGWFLSAGVSPSEFAAAAAAAVVVDVLRAV